MNAEPGDARAVGGPPPVAWIEPRRLVAVILVADILVIASHFLLGQLAPLGAVFDLDAEANLPTWYSSLKWALAATAAGICFHAERNERAGHGRPWRAAWIGLAVLMLGMSLDETAQVHEVIIDALMSQEVGENLRSAFGATVESDSLLWGVVFSPVLILTAVGVLLLYGSRFRARPGQLGWCVSAVGLLVGALILETREASVLSAGGFPPDAVWKTYRVYATIEEIFEIVAGTIFLAVHSSYGHRLLAAPGGTAGPAPAKRERRLAIPGPHRAPEGEAPARRRERGAGSRSEG